MSVPRQFLRFAVRYLSSADIVEVLIARSFELPLQEFGRDSQLYKSSAFPALAAMITVVTFALPQSRLILMLQLTRRHGGK